MSDKKNYNDKPEYKLNVSEGKEAEASNGFRTGDSPFHISRKGIYRHRLTVSDIDRIWSSDRARTRKLMLTVCASVFVIFILCSMVRYNVYYYEEKFAPVSYIKCWFTGIRFLIERITGSYSQADADAIIAALGGEPEYLGSFARLKISLMSFVAGAGVAMAGAIFQTAYKNPMASPNIIGATAGVQLGNVIMVMMYSAAAASQIITRYKFCYGLTAVCVVGVLLLGKFAGDKRDSYSVMEMVMIGSIVSQALGVISMYLMYNLEDEDLLAYQQLTLGTYLETDILNMGMLIVVMLIATVPVLLMRYRLNIIGLDKSETTSIGLDSGKLRIVAQVCGVLMVTSAMIHFGTVGMISMVVPYMVRKGMSSDFRYVCVYSALFGGIVLVFCRTLASFFMIAETPLPVSTVINLVMMPVFMFILATQRRDDI